MNGTVNCTALCLPVNGTVHCPPPCSPVIVLPPTEWSAMGWGIGIFGTIIAVLTVGWIDRRRDEVIPSVNRWIRKRIPEKPPPAFGLACRWLRKHVDKAEAIGSPPTTTLGVTTSHPQMAFQPPSAQRQPIHLTEEQARALFRGPPPRAYRGRGRTRARDMSDGESV